MKNRAVITILFAVLLVVTPGLFVAQNILQGFVKTLDTNEPMIGANIVIDRTSEGTVTDLDGRFSMSTTRSYPVAITVSFLGYETINMSIANADPVIIVLSPANIFAEEIVVSASRRAEKLQEAPAAVSIINAKQVSASGGSVTPIRALINTPGVELQQQTGQRINLALRGSSGVFATDVFPMLDYRSLITPGLELFDSQNSPINNIDVERIEVVLGPGSALYGPDVTSGVVHFISKDPFRYPGTTVEFVGGERSTLKAAIRHAGHSEDAKFGYKINARYGRGNDFILDPTDPVDASVLSNFVPEIRRGTVTEQGYIDPSIPGPLLFNAGQVQDEDWWAAAVNGQLHFRPNDDTQIVGAGGWNAGSAIFYNELGEGYVSSNEYWGQVRLNHKGLFAQTYYILNDGGDDNAPAYLNRTGLIVPLQRSHFEAQVQYNFNMPNFLNSEWTTGIDFRHATANSENHVYGRNEDKDDYTLHGAYVQTKLKFGEKVDLFLAGRYDGYNFTDENTFSPRAALVYKPSSKHSIRLSYNRAANPIPASDIYFDLPLQATSVFNVWNLGGIRPQTFGQEPVISWIIPGVPSTLYSQGFPLAAAYQQVTPTVIAGIEQLGGADPTLAPLVPILSQLLSSQLPLGFTSEFISTDLGGNQLLPEDISTVLISKLTAYEIGYKGLFFDKLAAGIDIYYFRKTAGGGFGQVSPIITLTNLPTDLGNEVQASFQPQIESILFGQGFDSNTAAFLAAQVGEVLNGAYTQAGEAFLAAIAAAGLPFHGIVPTLQVPTQEFPHLAFGYATRDPDAISDDWGFEVHTRYYFTDDLTAFGNYTWFNNPSGQAGDLNFPQNKVRLGLGFTPDKGWQGSASYQWDQAYTSNQSTFPGMIDAKSLVDAQLGYTMDNGLTIEASATNLFNNEFRALPGFPKIGRTIVGRVVYSF